MPSATIGAGQTYATIPAFASAEPAGTRGLLFDALFDIGVSLFLTTPFHFISQIANQGVEIRGSGLVLNLGGGTILENILVKGTGTSIVTQGSFLNVSDCIFDGDTGNAAQGSLQAGGSSFITNSIGRNNPTGFGIVANSCVVTYSAVANCAKGFGGASAYRYCLAGNNGTADFPASGVTGDHNASEDGSAPGDLSVTGFDPLDWTNQDGSDLTIRDAIKATTKAFFSGEVPTPGATIKDFQGNTRQAAQAYAGPHDPDPVIVATPAGTRPLALYKIAIQNFFLNSTNLLDWIQTVDAGGSTAGRVILGYSAVSTPPDIATKGPKVFVSGRAVGIDNDEALGAYIATFEIFAEIIWAMDHTDNAPFTVEENFTDLLLDEAAGLGFNLETTLSGTIESVNIAKIELDDGTEGQGRRERRTVMEFLITYPIPK